MKRMPCVLLAMTLLLLSLTAFAQDMTQDVTAEASATAPTKVQAVSEALRQAVEQTVGVAVSSETRVENAQLIMDVISAKAQGYVTKYDIVAEKNVKDGVEVKIKAIIPISMLKADVKKLTQALGGMRILVFYDFGKVKSAQDSTLYEFACDRVEEYLSRNKYRYVNRNHFDQPVMKNFIKRIRKPMPIQADSFEVMADRPGVDIEVTNIISNVRNMALDSKAATAVVDFETYDAYTSEGMGKTVGDCSQEQLGTSDILALRTAISAAVEKGCFSLLREQLSAKLNDWYLAGRPFTVLFEKATYEQIRPLKAALEGDPRFGGQIESSSPEVGMVGFNLTFKDRPDKLADAILDLAQRVGGSVARVRVKKLDRTRLHFVL